MVFLLDNNNLLSVRWENQSHHSPVTFHHLSSLSAAPSLYQHNRKALTLSLNTAWHGELCPPPHTAAPPWSLVLNIKSRYFGGWGSLCKATDWYTGIVVGGETCEEWQTFSLEVINANGAIKCYGKSTLHWIYFWVEAVLALLGEDHSGRKNLLCCRQTKATLGNMRNTRSNVLYFNQTAVVESTVTKYTYSSTVLVLYYIFCYFILLLYQF